MGLGNVLLLAQVIAYFVSFVFSFFFYIPIAVNVKNFDGNCLLYARGQWVENIEQGPQLTDVQWGPDSACNFGIFMGVIVMLLSIFFVIWESIYLFKGTDSSWVDAFLTAVLSGVVSVMLFSSALTLSIGFEKWCDTVTDHKSSITSCEEGDYMSFFKVNYPQIKNRYYFIEMQMAQFGAWIVFICWAIITVMAIVKIVKFHRQEAFLTSMSRERQRLLQKVGREPTQNI